MTLARATSSGVRVGVATGLGIAAGDLIHTVLAVVGISALVLASMLLFSLEKYLGAGYLVWLGLKAILAKTEPALPVAGASPAPSRRSGRRCWPKY